MNQKNKSQLVHDLNSNLSALEQSLSILCSLALTSPSAELLPLCHEKMQIVLKDWKDIKEYLK